MGPTGNIYSLQIHVTKKCNLQCLHCYSRSGPLETEVLPFEVLEKGILGARREGFNYVSFSGGEPFLYAPLSEALALAKSQNFSTSVTSNGMFLTVERLKKLKGNLDLLAISLDGTPSSHNKMRGSSKAFEVMEKRLGALQQSGIPFGFIFTLTLHNLDELSWVADFALKKGARLLQIHPLEKEGRAQGDKSLVSPDAFEAACAFIETLRLQSLTQKKLKFHIDFADSKTISEEPERALVRDFQDEIPQNLPLSQLISPIVIETDGTLSPLQYGFDRRYAFGNLNSAPFETVTASWKETKYEAFQTLCRKVHKNKKGTRDLPFFNFYEALMKEAKKAFPKKINA